MKSALFISPHFDDVAFSCGGLVKNLINDSQEVTLVTVFTKSQHPFNDFAIDCQVSKGISLDIDYLELRSKENDEFAKTIGTSKSLDLGLIEAPYRGYNSSASLFAESEVQEPEIIKRLALTIFNLLEENSFAQVYFPAALGNHVDHVITKRACEEVMKKNINREIEFLMYEDLPYAMNVQAMKDSPQFDMNDFVDIDITKSIDEKIKGILSYKSQIGFQFGNEQLVREKIKRYSNSLKEGKTGEYYERYCRVARIFA